MQPLFYCVRLVSCVSTKHGRQFYIYASYIYVIGCVYIFDMLCYTHTHTHIDNITNPRPVYRSPIAHRTKRITLPGKM